MTKLGFDYDEHPALFRSADAASISLQKWNSRLVAGNLILLTVAAVAGTEVFSKILGDGLAVVALATSSIAAVIATILIASLQLERKWYSARAVAESVKTLTWRYITCAPPFETGLVQSVVDDNFCDVLSGLLKDKVDFAFGESIDCSEPQEITQKMRQVRTSDLSFRKSLYLSERVEDQRRWYATKAGTNKRNSNKWLIGIIVVEMAVVFVALFSMRSSQWSQSVGVLAAVAAVFLAWLQMKRHQELAQSYSVAAHELGLIFAKGESVDTREMFESFVIDSENAMSREHTLWLAKRGSLD